MKNFFASKINWAGLILILTAIMDVIKNWGDQPINVVNVVMAIIGIAIIIIRTFTAQEPITKAAAKDKLP